MKHLLTASLLAYMPLIAFAAPDAKSGAAAGGTAPAASKPATAETTKSKEPKEPKEKKRGIGTAAIEAIKDGKTNQEALAAVRAEFPDANTTMASINWYRNDLRTKGALGTNGKLVPSARDQAKDAKATDEKAKPKADAKPEAKDPTA